MGNIKRRYWKSYKIIRAIMAVLLFIGGVVSLFCGIIELMDYRNIKLMIIAMLVIVTSVALFSAAYFSMIGLQYNVVVDEEGLILYKGKRIKRFLQWDEIRDVGIGYRITHVGGLETLYFCDRVLSDEMKNHLELLNVNCIYFIDLTEEELETVKKKCLKGKEDVIRWIQER